MHIQPMTPKLKPPGAQRLKLRCVTLPSNSAFKFNMRRYTKEPVGSGGGKGKGKNKKGKGKNKVRRCRLNR